MKKITMKTNGRDVNGNKKYLYNFIDTNRTTPTEQKEINKMFNCYGRLTNKGISNQLDIYQMQEWLRRFGSWLSTTTSKELSKAQKDIDRCNCKQGCRAYCSIQRQSVCGKLQRHSMLIDDLNYLQEWLKLDIEEVA